MMWYNRKRQFVQILIFVMSSIVMTPGKQQVYMCGYMCVCVCLHIYMQVSHAWLNVCINSTCVVILLKLLYIGEKKGNFFQFGIISSVVPSEFIHLEWERLVLVEWSVTYQIELDEYILYLAFI